MVMSNALWKQYNKAKRNVVFKAAYHLKGWCLKYQLCLLNGNFLHLIMGLMSNMMMRMQKSLLA